MKLQIIAASCAAAALVACGGGGGSDAPAPVPVATLQTLTLSGTAAEGAALAGALIEVQCVNGSGISSAGSDGVFTVSISAGALPCLLRAPLRDGTYLHSAVNEAISGTAAVNITPVTELVVAQAAGVPPETLFSDFKAGTPTLSTSAITSAALTDAVAAVKTTLVAAGVDLGSVNPLSSALVIGDAQDQKLDALAAKLADSGTSLGQLTRTVVAGSPVNTTAASVTTPPPSTTLNGTPSLPADLLLKPAAANCAALRSGVYRVVNFQASDTATAGTAPAFPVAKVTVDATALVVDNHDGSTDTLHSVGNCRYVFGNQFSEMVVSQSGVIVIRRGIGGGAARNALAFPEQSMPVAALTGEWNALAWQRGNGTTATFHAEAYTGSFDSTGKLTALTGCTDVMTCVTADAANLPAATLTANATGGFDFNNTTDKSTDRVFAYRAGGGELMAVSLSADGSFSVWTRKRTNALPEAGTLTRNVDLSIDATLLSTGFGESGNTITVVDAATSAYQRTTFGLFNNGATFATWTQSLQANTPRAGYNLRLGETGVPTSASGVTVTTREFVSLGLRGMGLAAVTISANNPSGDNQLYLFSVAQSASLPWLPDSMLQRPFDRANCAYLRSGTYRAAKFAASSPGSYATGLWSVSATNLNLTYVDSGTSTKLTPVSNCRYTSADGTSLVVSPAGVIAARSADGKATIAFPVQEHTVAALAGTWNKLGTSATTSGSYVVDAATATIDASGAITATLYCANVASCDSVTGKTITLKANPSGGFDRSSSDGWTDRVFAFQAGNGDLMLVNLASDGSVGFWTRQRANLLPTVGTRNRSWDLSIDPGLTAVLSEGSNTIASVDSKTGVAVRARKTATGASYSEKLQMNTPRDGYNFRPSATVTASDGSSVNIREFTSLSMRSMGFSPLKLVGTSEQLMISVLQP